MAGILRRRCAVTACCPTLKAEGVSKREPVRGFACDPLVYQVEQARQSANLFALRECDEAVPNGLNAVLPFFVASGPGDGLDEYGRVLHGPAAVSEHAANRESRLVAYLIAPMLGQKGGRGNARDAGFEVRPVNIGRVSGTALLPGNRFAGLVDRSREHGLRPFATAADAKLDEHPLLVTISAGIDVFDCRDVAYLRQRRAVKPM